jgi:hypothetical protein
MTFSEQRKARAAQYRNLARVQSDLGDTTSLPQVREKHVLAAARWSALAALDEQPTTAR